jgi:hypothetical protein
MSERARLLRGTRADLRGVRGAGRLERFGIEGPGTGSLDGIQRMTRLREAQLMGVRDVDLTPLGALSTLEVLLLDGVRGAQGYAAFGRLTNLRVLMLLNGDPQAAAEIAALDLSGLATLEALTLGVPGECRVPLSLAWMPLQRLRQITLSGFALTDSAVPRLAAASSLRSVTFQPTGAAQLATLRAAMPGANVSSLDAGGPPYDQVIATQTDRGVVFSLALDAAEELGVETNVEAEDVLRDVMSERGLELAGLEFDTESAAVWLVSPQREHLDAVRELLRELAAQRRHQ